MLFGCQLSHISSGRRSVYCNMTRNLQRNRQGVATCQQRLFRNQMEKLFLSLSSSNSLWPRYFCSLQSLAKLGPCYSCASKINKHQLKYSKTKNPALELFFLYWSLVFLLIKSSLLSRTQSCTVQHSKICSLHLTQVLAATTVQSLGTNSSFKPVPWSRALTGELT